MPLLKRKLLQLPIHIALTGETSRHWSIEFVVTFRPLVRVIVGNPTKIPKRSGTRRRDKRSRKVVESAVYEAIAWKAVFLCLFFRVIK